MTQPDKLYIAEPVIATTVTINGQEICSKEDWDRMVNYTMRENERLKEENELFRKGFGLAQSIQDHRNKESDNG